MRNARDVDAAQNPQATVIGVAFRLSIACSGAAAAV